MHPDAETVLRGFQAFAEGDLETLRGLFHDDAVWHTGGRSRWGGDYRGADAIIEFFGKLGGSATLENDLHAVLADDEHVVVLTKTRMRAGEHSHEGDTFFVFHVDEGKVRETWVAEFDQQAEDEFWEKVG